jgi:hypothetical protein
MDLISKILIIVGSLMSLLAYIFLGFPQIG